MSNLKHNYFYNLMYQILVVFLPLVTAPYVSRVLGPSNIGTFSFSLSIASMFTVFGYLGWGTHGNRTIAMVRDDRQKRSLAFWCIFSIQLSCSLIVCIAYCVYAAYITKDPLISWLWLPYIISVGTDVNWYFFGEERFKLTVTRNAVVKVSVCVLLFIVVRTADDLWCYILLMSSSYLMSNVVLWPFLLKDLDFVRPTLAQIKKHIHPTLVLFIPIVAASVYTTFDKVVLGMMSTMDQAGYFENALKFPSLILSVVTALGTIMLPRVTYLVTSGQENRVNKYLSISIWFTSLTSLALTFGLMGISLELAPVFFGQKFTESGPVLMILALEIPFMGWSNVLVTQYLIPYQKEKIYATSAIVGACVNVVINILLIPFLGAMGAAYATVAAQAVVCLYQIIQLRHILPIQELITENLPYFIFAVFMCVCVRFIGFAMGATVFGIIAQIIFGAAIYIILCLAYFFKTKNHYAYEVLMPFIKKTPKV